MWAVLTAGFGIRAVGAQAGVSGRIAFDAAFNCIWVTGFPEESPATLEDVFQADREQGWGKVVHEPPTDTYTLRTSLWIGNGDDLGTFFQWKLQSSAGDSRHSGRSLGPVPETKPGPRHRSPPRDCQPPRGRGPVHAAIRPTIKIACAKPGQFGLFVGGVPNTDAPGGDLFLYNTTVTAATPDREHAWRESAAIRGQTAPTAGSGRRTSGS